MPERKELSRDELITFVGEQAARIVAQDAQIATMAAQMADLLDANEVLASRLAKMEHLLSRNSKNSSNPPSKWSALEVLRGWFGGQAGLSR